MRDCKVFDLRLTRAFGTAEVLAIRAFGRFADECSVAFMTCPAHSMDRCLPHDFISSWNLWHHEQLRFRPRPRIRSRIHSNSRHRWRRCGFSLRLGLGFLGRFARKARTLLTAGMRAVAADFLGPESDLAAVTLTMNAHAHRFLHSARVAFPHRGPLAGFERQAPFCEEGAGFLLLELVVRGGGGDGREGDGEFGGLGGGFLYLGEGLAWLLGSGRDRWGGCGGALGGSEV